MNTRKNGVLFFVGLLFTLILVGCGQAVSTPTTTSQPPQTQPVTQEPSATLPPVTVTPPPVLTWKVTHTFKGSGVFQTGVFTISDDIKLAWKATSASDAGGYFNFAVFVYRPPKEGLDLAVNVFKQGNAGGETEIHGDGGQVYLSIEGEAAWTITVSELS